jgi:hypothetical protein
VKVETSAVVAAALEALAHAAEGIGRARRPEAARHDAGIVDLEIAEHHLTGHRTHAHEK